MFAPCAALITYHLHHSLLLTHSNHSVTLIKSTVHIVFSCSLRRY